jgi:hypothetical protein
LWLSVRSALRAAHAAHGTAGYWLPLPLLATGCWLLATGYWLLATGYWLLALLLLVLLLLLAAAAAGHCCCKKKQKAKALKALSTEAPNTERGT